MLKCSANKFNKICAATYPDRGCAPDTQRLPAMHVDPVFPPARVGQLPFRHPSWSPAEVMLSPAA